MKIRYSPEAVDDLLKIRTYIELQWDDSQLSQRTIKRITKKIRMLEIFPYMGIELGKMIGVPTEYRSLFCEKNYIFYRVDRDVIRIVRILNEKEDYMRTLFGIVEVKDDTEE